MAYDFNSLDKVKEEQPADLKYYRDYTNIADTIPEVEAGKKDNVSMTLARWIRQKMYGRDVRESIAQFVEWVSVLTNKAIDKVDDNAERQTTLEEQFQSVLNETTSKDVISAPEIIAARGGKATLGERLDETTMQLAELIHNIFIDGLVLDGVTDNTQTIVNELSQKSSGIFTIPYNCNCDRDTILNSINSSVVVIDPHYQVIQGQYVAKYFKLLTAKNEPNNDSAVVVEDFNHPCIVVNNRNDPSASNSKRATIGFSNGYSENGFLKFTFMISQYIMQNHYALLFRRMSTLSGECKDSTAFSINELGQLGFNTGAPGSDYDYVFKASELRANRDKTLIQVGNDAGGRSGITLVGNSNGSRLDIFTDPTEKGIIGYGLGKQIKMDTNSIMFDTNEKIKWNNISGATPSATKGRFFLVNNSSTVDMTGFNCDADIVTLMFTNSNTTLKTAGFQLKGSKDWTPHKHDSITLVKNDFLTGKWIEISRTETGL